MKRILLLTILTLSLVGCTSEIKRTATDNGFISPSSPSLNFEFDGFEFKESSKHQQPYNFVSYFWEAQNAGRSIEIDFITIPRGHYNLRKPDDEREKKSLCAGFATIENERFRTQIRVHSSNKLIFKDYLLFLNAGKYVKLFYFEEIPQAVAAEYLAWQSKKNNILATGGTDAAHKLVQKRRETVFNEILEFEKRADAIFGITEVERYIP